MVLCIFIGVHEESEGNAFGAIAGQQQMHAKYTPSICFELFNATVFLK